MEILKWLENSEIVENYRVQDYRRFSNGFYIKIKVELNNNSELFIREYSDLNERNYSYHWQNEKCELLVRWDNAPYHSGLENHPHHKHINKTIESSKEVTLLDVLKVIHNKIIREDP
jgi:hypothetical protein